MAGRAWKILALVAVLALFSILEFQTIEAQTLVNECQTDTTHCDANAYCYDTINAYDCICQFGWYGDGFVGAGYSGCQKNKWEMRRQMTTSIMGFILVALLILWCLLNCIRKCMRLRARAWNINMAQQQVAQAQQAYPPQQGVLRPAGEV